MNRGLCLVVGLLLIVTACDTSRRQARFEFSACQPATCEELLAVEVPAHEYDSSRGFLPDFPFRVMLRGLTPEDAAREAAAACDECELLVWTLTPTEELWRPTDEAWWSELCVDVTVFLLNADGQPVKTSRVAATLVMTYDAAGQARAQQMGTGASPFAVAPVAWRLQIRPGKNSP